MDRVTFGVLGPVVAWDAAGGVLGLKGPRHRAVLARLLVARRRVVPVSRLVADLWEEPPAGAIGAVRTFVADLRRILEPDRPKRAPARLLVTEGPGYALRPEPDAVDAWRFEAAVGATLPPEHALTRLEDALRLWRGPSYADVAQEDWVRSERSRLAELRLHAVERLASVRLDLGLTTEAIPDLDAHLTDHPWREEAWRLLALALYRTGRQADSLAVLRRARTTLADQLGLDPSRKLRQLESDILAQAPHLDLPESSPRHSESHDGTTSKNSVDLVGAEEVWARAAAAYDRVVGKGAQARLESTVGLLRDLAVSGGRGLEAAREHRGWLLPRRRSLGMRSLRLG
ncbi:AfsR/SARP family transcriptional regulator [Nocardia terpenica]|uniref:AfsR/SARP family transcriptional regulator n=1 Tax=Nocardia terpenica TaxID=455432 RepID=UPI001EEAD3A4|nr:BTAD domain-containing putative transcriptional regulator [Nocardia terpenica]